MTTKRDISLSAALICSILLPAVVVNLAHIYIFGIGVLLLDIENYFPVLISIVLFSLPYGYFIYSERRSARLWIMQTILTAATWAIAAIIARHSGGEGGANIGIGLLMFVAPAITAVISLRACNELR